jgi:hypothetical protein
MWIWIRNTDYITRTCSQPAYLAHSILQASTQASKQSSKDPNPHKSATLVQSQQAQLGSLILLSLVLSDPELDLDPGRHDRSARSKILLTLFPCNGTVQTT